jgi:hypothetical protein
MQHLRLRHAGLDSPVEVRLTQNSEGRWISFGDYAENPDVGVADNPRQAIQNALAELGEPFASEMARSADLSSEPGDLVPARPSCQRVTKVPSNPS